MTHEDPHPMENAKPGYVPFEVKASGEKSAFKISDDTSEIAMGKKMCECGHETAPGYIVCLCCLHGTCEDIYNKIADLEVEVGDEKARAVASEEKTKRFKEANDELRASSIKALVSLDKVCDEHKARADGFRDKLVKGNKETGHYEDCMCDSCIAWSQQYQLYEEWDNQDKLEKCIKELEARIDKQVDYSLQVGNLERRNVELRSKVEDLEFEVAAYQGTLIALKAPRRDKESDD